MIFLLWKDLGNDRHHLHPENGSLISGACLKAVCLFVGLTIWIWTNSSHMFWVWIGKESFKRLILLLGNCFWTAD